MRDDDPRVDEPTLSPGEVALVDRVRADNAQRRRMHRRIVLAALVTISSAAVLAGVAGRSGGDRAPGAERNPAPSTAAPQLPPPAVAPAAPRDRGVTTVVSVRQPSRAVEAPSRRSREQPRVTKLVARTPASMNVVYSDGARGGLPPRRTSEAP
ncbi:MAG TPA: hypothetical protein VEA38_24960 [Terriglobales bacterium]|nr:hypothetical protein [Terriglobales bacterium]